MNEPVHAGELFWVRQTDVMHVYIVTSLFFYVATTMLAYKIQDLAGFN